MGEKKIVLTGGHAGTTAIAVAEEIIRRSYKGTSYEIYWIGSKSAVEGRQISTIESQVFKRMGIKHRTLNAGRVQLKFTRWTIPALLKIPLGFFQAVILISKIKPDVILSFGGFAAFPVVVIGRLMTIPVVIHEQTTVAGRANKLSSFLATKIALARSSSLRYYPRKKSIVIGNPLMTQIAGIEAKTTPAKPPVIFITGGSRGARVINQVVVSCLKDLLSTYYLVHHCGEMDYKKFCKIKSQLPSRLAERYELYSTIDPMKIDDVYRQADILISRAGANTVSEIIATRRPAVLVPLLYSYLNEQLNNARFAQTFGLVKVIEQAQFSPQSLFPALEHLFHNYSNIVNQATEKASPDLLASAKLVDLLEEVSQ